MNGEIYVKECRGSARACVALAVIDDVAVEATALIAYVKALNPVRWILTSQTGNAGWNDL